MNNFETWDQIKRTKQIISVLVKYGLDCFIDQTKVNFWLKIRKKPKKLQKLIPPRRLRLALEELGPTFVKFGQILSTRPDFLPPDFIKELEKLQDKVSPFNSFHAQKIIEKELNKPLKELFKKFETKPIAAASLSQVHKAILFNNKTVAIKVQRPNIKDTIELDLKILESIAGVLESRLYNNWVYQPKLIVAELKKAIKKEINFINEAYNFERFRVNFKNFKNIKIPKIYWEMSTSKILTMEFMEGVKINEITQEKYKNIFNAKEIAKQGAQAILKQILEDGFFHADPHPANLLVQPPSTIVILDAGMVGYLDEETIFKIAKLLQATIDKNLNQIINCLENLGVVVREVDKNLFREDLKELLDRYFGLPLKHLEIKKISEDLLEVMVRHHLVLPSNFVLMLKALSMEESIGKKLDPDFNMISTAKPFVKKTLRKKFMPHELLRKGSDLLQESAELIEELPGDLIDILHKFKEGKLKFNFKHQDLEKLIKEINRSSNHISLSLIISALIIGSSLILQQQSPFISGYPVLGIIGYLLASFLGVELIILILKSDKQK